MADRSAQQRWREELAGWEIPADILARAPEPPWGFPVALFQAGPDSPQTTSRDVALERLPTHGSVLDVGCGGGAAGLALAPPAAVVIGVDEGADMLASFAATAEQRDVMHRAVHGVWPDVASTVDVADVVVCHHVLYNVADVAPFVAALTTHARRRVVLELTARHPMTDYRELWQQFHGLDRPDGPTAQLAAEMLRELGIDVQVRQWQRPARDVPREAYVRLYRQRLCLPVDAEPEIDRVLGPMDAPRDAVTLWWDLS